jgi:Zn-dependent metalloprotease
MFTKSKIHQIVIILVALTMLFSAIQPSAASAQSGDGLKRQVNPQSGRVSFIGPETGRVFSASRALGTFARPQDPAMALASRYAPEFGLKDPGRDLSEMKSKRSEDGRLTVRYQQNYNGIPVLGGELIVDTNDNGDLYSMNGEVSPNLSLPTQPTIDPAQAAETALQAMAKWYQRSPEDFVASEPELWIYDESLLRPSTRPVELVWRMEVIAKDNAMPVRELVLVNAERGGISLHFNQIDTAWDGKKDNESNTHVENIPALAVATWYAATTGNDNNINGSYKVSATVDGLADPADLQLINGLQVSTYTANHSSSLPGTFLCDQTDPTCTEGSNPHADAAHKYAIGTYDFYANNFLRDSIDNNGLPIISTVQYCDPFFPCPYNNAYWSGAQMVYGSAYGFPLADDIVAHELTHGVTQYESNLFYYYQSGAINESFSDLWGEYYDQSNGQGNDTAGVKWLLGEDTTGLGAIRNMSNPPQFQHPDRMSSTYYYEGGGDNGGVHSNSGVNNKAVYLMVDGGTFNGRTVTALGWEKTGAIYYEVNTNLLSSGADYSDLYYALQQACSNLIGQHGITAGNCVEVKDAADAVEMNIQPAPNFNTDAPLCTTAGTFPKIFFADDLESGTSNWTFNNGTYTRWQYDSPYGPYAQSGLHSLYADDAPAAVTDATARLSSFVVPANAYLHFAHAYDFETDAYYWDGGVLEYSLNGGATWADAGPLMTHNGYKGTIYPDYNNPLKGRSAFVGTSHGYISTRLNLASLAGQTVTFRWRMGLDAYVFAWGWWVDNIKAYTCSAPVISGNAGAAGVVLSYTDGTFKTVTSQANGSYSLPVSYNWSGTVTPSHPCYTFTPVSRTYNNVTANQTNQNYTATFNPASGCANINVDIGANLMGNYGLLPSQEKREFYPASGGPVVVESTNAMDIIAAIRLQSMKSGTLLDYNETMGIPEGSLSTKYIFPVYENLWAPLNSQLRFAHLGAGTRTIKVTIGTETWTYDVAEGQDKRIFLDRSGGPVIVESLDGVTKIVAAIRLQAMSNNVLHAYSETFGIPIEDLSTRYYFPVYENKWAPLNSQLRFAHLGAGTRTIKVTIGSETWTYDVAEGEDKRIFLDRSGGPVIIESLDGVTKVIAAIRLQSMKSGILLDYNETMGIPEGSLSTKYIFPVYENLWAPLNSQLRFAHLGAGTRSIKVTIGTETWTYDVAEGQDKRIFLDRSGGPVIVESLDGVTQVVAAIRLQCMKDGILNCYSETMGIPFEFLSDTYYFPVYENLWAPLNSQVRFGVP